MMTDHAGNFIDGDDAPLMCAGGNSERAVRFITNVKMETDGEHGLEDLRWWPGVMDAVFHAGEIEAGSGDFFREGKHEVLMPGDFPVRIGCFVEGDGLDGDGGGRKMSGADQLSGDVERGLADGGMIQQASFAGSSGLEKFGPQLIASSPRKLDAHQGEAIFFKAAHAPYFETTLPSNFSRAVWMSGSL